MPTERQNGVGAAPKGICINRLRGGAGALWRALLRMGARAVWRRYARAGGMRARTTIADTK